MNLPRRLSPLLLTPLALACSDSRGAGPLAPDGAAPATFSLSPAQESGLSAALEDARVRLLPALSEGAGSGELGRSLDALQAALSTREAAVLRYALSRGDAALQELEAAGEGAPAADLDAVRLVLTEARLLLTAPPAASR